MINVIHTIEGPDPDFLLAEIKRGLTSVENVAGFKFASVNKQINTDEIMVVSKWDSQGAYEQWTRTVGENKAFKQATPQLFDVLEEMF